MPRDLPVPCVPGRRPGVPSDHRPPTPEQFLAVQQSEEFGQLRRSFRGFAIPMTIAFLVWYLAYVLLSTYAEGFMSIHVIGNLNIGIILGSEPVRHDLPDHLAVHPPREQDTWIRSPPGSATSWRVIL